MQNKTKNQTAKLQRALNSFLNVEDSENVSQSLQRVFFGYILTDDFSELSPREKDGLVHTYVSLIEFLKNFPQKSINALKYFLNMIEPDQAISTMDKMLNAFMLTEDFCESMEGERLVVVGETKGLISLFSFLKSDK